MTDTPLHVHPDTHLYEGAFSELVADHLSGGDDILIAAPDADTADSILSTARERHGPLSGRVEVYYGDQSDLPFEADAFDVAVHFNPGRGVLQRHVPLYEMTAVVRSGGKVIYRAPNYLAHSTAVDINTLYALGWGDHGDPTVAGLFDVTTSGDPRENAASADTRQTATLSDF